jgi:recombinational DNA repair protein (RecF pathway)
MTEPRTDAGRRLQGEFVYGTLRPTLEYVTAAILAIEAEAAKLDVERLRLAGFEPDFNVCGGCHHHGSRHDLNNRCLDCGDYFASMNEAAKWAWGAAEYERLSDER